MDLSLGGRDVVEWSSSSIKIHDEPDLLMWSSNPTIDFYSTNLEYSTMFLEEVNEGMYWW